MTLKPSAHKPSWLLPWLSHQDSMMDKLSAEASQAKLSVKQHGWAKSGWWERYLLGLSSPKVLRREVVVSSGGHACWYARTTIPEQCYENHHADLFSRLTTESLGAILFSDARIKRQQLSNDLIDADCLEYYWLNERLRAGAASFWSRLSLFTINETSPFYLIEILLPGLFQATQGQK